MEKLEFLSNGGSKIVRTTLYNDQEFSPFEIELLHTPIMQRLYSLKQLGFADKVFPDAVHSRFNHILGVTEMAERMIRRLSGWLQDCDAAASFNYVDEREGAHRSQWSARSISSQELAKLVEQRIPVVRLVALLHDLTHAAFGHTLEDEVCVFAEKHDEPARQVRFFNALVGQLLHLWAVEIGCIQLDPDIFDALARLEVNEREALGWAERIKAKLDSEQVTSLARQLRDLETALTLLNYIEFLHETRQEHVPAPPALLVSAAIEKLDADLPKLDVILHRDAFLVDIVGNTICADLLDYARRDAGNAGLRVQFDERFIRYICNVSVFGDLSPTGQPCIRIAFRCFTDKVRYDVLSEMSGILKARYLINERVLFHPTKCAAGAMLGTAVQLLGLDKVPSWMQVMGDQEFLRILVELARRMSAEAREPSAATAPARPGDRLSELVSTCLDTLGKSGSRRDVEERIRGARTLIWRLTSRRYHKLVYRVRGGLSSPTQTDVKIAGKYRQPTARFQLERQIEELCNLPSGSVVIHCPTRKMSMKAAQALVVGAASDQVTHLRDVNTITDVLGPYTEEIHAVEKMYRAIWQLHVYLDSSQMHKSDLVISELSDALEVPNDELLQKPASVDAANPYALLVGKFHKRHHRACRPDIVKRLDELDVRHRHSKTESVVERAIKEVENGAGKENKELDFGDSPA